MATTTNINGTNLWNGPSLLVPVDVEALVVSDRATNLPWAYGKMDYGNANDFENIRPNLAVDIKPRIGVTLHWSLPDALTHGRADDGTKIKYPTVPNRWLVVRLNDGQARSWVLQSDFTDLFDGSNSYLDPNTDVPTRTTIGKRFDDGKWNGEGDITQDPFLTALAPGNASFAAFVPNIDNVFSFYDDMSGIENRELKVTYVVSGWYSKAENDPLFGPTNLEAWEKHLLQLNWSVGGETEISKALSDWKNWAQANNIAVDPNVFSDNYPVRTLCHGMVYNVNWLGVNGKPQSGRPSPDKGDKPYQYLPRVAAGNTSIDALAALVQSEIEAKDPGGKGKAAAELLEAFNYNLVDKYDKPGGQFELYREVFKAWFSATDGEQYYYIEDTDKPDTPFIEPDRLAKLVELNSKAAELSIKKHLLSARQKYLYGNWWKTEVAIKYGKKSWPKEVPDKATWDKIVADLRNSISADPARGTDIQEIVTLKADIATLEGAVGDLKTAVQENLGTTRALKENTGGRYYQPNDPAILIYGAGRGYRHGEDGRFDAEGKMLTRFTGQTISALTVAPDGKSQAVAVGNLTLPPILEKAAFIPKETVALIADAYFFDTGNAASIAKIACTLLGIPYNDSYATDVARQQTGAWNADVYRLDRVMVADAAGFTGVIPSKISVNPWAAPWAPLYMVWDITWKPSATNPKNALDGWKFNPATLEYDWQNKVGGDEITLRGSTTITPKSAFVMRAQLEKYFESHKFPELQDFLSTVSNWDFLSQNLSGFNDMLLALNADQFNLPDSPEELVKAIGNNTQLSPKPQAAAGFSPIRAGHFKLNTLWVVDDFGQVFDPISVIGPSESYPIIRGTGMVTADQFNMIQLPPRITQNARLNFDLMSGDGVAHDIQEDQTVNPICGWLLPNHIDKALSVYTPDGHLLGELILVDSGQGIVLRWDDAPGKNIPVGTPLNEIIENKYLLQMVEQLLDKDDAAAAFTDLLNTIDKTLWTIEPLGGRNNELVSVFIGRPLALVKTRMQYQLRSGKQHNQSWVKSAQKLTGEYEKVPFPIQLGSIQNPQDGVLGYYFDDFSTFNSLWKDGAKTDYITTNPVSLTFEGEAKDVFVLADPRGEMNAISGILPISVTVLPGPLVENAMSNMNVTFRTGPLITDPDKLAMPLPSEMSGNWSWIQHTGITTWEEVSDITRANQKPRFGNNNVLKDGWLKLSNALKEQNT